jgi:tRNA pseudouridine32 synthase / 23S rRNA pseudouridine746 synthase
MEASAFMAQLSEEVLFADEHLVVAVKPAGLLCVPGRGPDKQDCLAARMAQRFGDALTVHRLDMATSGLVVFARGIEMQRRLSRAFEEREVHKRYVAVAAGRLDSADWSVVDLPLAADWPRRPLQKVDVELGKPSLTRWRTLAFEGANTRVELKPVTGRSHQLRVHLRELGHPILGDALYAPPEVQAQAPRLLLHAAQLRLAHPATGESLTFERAPPF